MEYRILGPLELSDGGRPVARSARKQRVLLLCLLLHRNEAVSVDRLVDALWGERPPRSAAKLVQVYVSQLRRVLGEGALETRPPGYLIRVGPEQLDAARFEQLLADGRQAQAAPNAQLAASLFRRALVLWRGPALADAADEEFAAAEAGRLEELRLDCLEERIGADLELGHHEHAHAALAALVAEHPLRERLRAQLMLALYRSGRQAEALDAYRAARRTLTDGLGIEPSTDLRELERAILRHDEKLAAPAREPVSRTRLPTPVTPLVGRGRELAELGALIERPDVRLVTLAGAAGSGKTRLALAIAQAAGDEFADGCAFVEVAALNDPALVVPTIGRALGVAERPDEPIESTLAAWLSEREVLLLLDNLEHLAAAGPALVGLAAAAPGVKLLMTSRLVLHLSGEHVFPVPPLQEDDAVKLFAQRARSLQRTFVLTDETEADVREICRRLDGLPLAIELAAARTGMLSPRALLERLTTRLTVLTGGPRDLPARQQTLRETLDWSANLLEENERQVLARLAVFPGGCTLPAAETVCGADLDTLSKLVDHSLVRRADVDCEPRFLLLETVREYAQELLGTGRVEAERSLTLYFCELVESADLRGVEQTRWLTRLDTELDNLRAALDYAAGSSEAELELRLTGALWRYWWIRGYLSEGRTRIEGLLEREADADPSILVRVLHGGAGLAWSVGDYRRAWQLATELLAAARTSSAAFEELSAHLMFGVIAMKEKDYETARRHLTKSAALAEAHGLEQEVVRAKMNLGVVALESGDFEASVPVFEAVLVHHSRSGVTEVTGFTLLNLGLAAYRLGQLGRARERFDEARSVLGGIGFRARTGHALQGLAAVEASSGCHQEAARLLGRADALLAEIGASANDFDPTLATEVEAEARDRLGDDGFAAAYEEGRESTPRGHVNVAT